MGITRPRAAFVASMLFAWSGWVGAAAGPVTPAAAEPKVMRVLVVETVDLRAYRHELELLLTLARTAVPDVTLRVWRARFAGADTGTVVVAAELPSLAALATLESFGKSNAEYAAIVRRIQALHHVISDSIYEETPP
jgi:hypothetical protein